MESTSHDTVQAIQDAIQHLAKCDDRQFVFADLKADHGVKEIAHIIRETGRLCSSQTDVTTGFA